VSNNDGVCGYLISRENEIVELAFFPGTAWSQVLFDFAEIRNLESIKIHCSPEHPVLQHLGDFDLTLALRECRFGGHMVKVLDEERLLNGIALRAGKIAKKHGFKGQFTVPGKAVIRIAEDNSKVIPEIELDDFDRASFFMSTKCLSEKHPPSMIYPQQSFNVPFFDQL
jgi:hypothetical protein